jgi:hypothetical protein
LSTYSGAGKRFTVLVQLRYGLVVGNLIKIQQRVHLISGSSSLNAVVPAFASHSKTTISVVTIPAPIAWRRSSPDHASEAGTNRMI